MLQRILQFLNNLYSKSLPNIKHLFQTYYYNILKGSHEGTHIRMKNHYEVLHIIVKIIGLHSSEITKVHIMGIAREPI